MFENLRLRPRYGGFVFLADATKGVPWLATHHHAELELNIVARGHINYVVGKNRYHFAKGDQLWLFPGQPHRLVDRSQDALYYVAVFKQSLIHKACQQEFELVRRMMDALIAGAPDNDALNREAGFGLSPGFRYEHEDSDFLNAGLSHVLISCWKNQLASQEGNRAVPLHHSILKALDILCRDEQPGNLPALAKQCGLSPEHLSRTFQKQIGIPLNRYRNAARLDRFWKLRNSPPQKTLIEAALAAGFGSYAQFYKIFREAYGRGPREETQAPESRNVPGASAL
jgi:AraC-like DNA-binding protein